MKCVKILTKNSVTSKVLIIAKQHLFKLILNSLPKFPNVSVIWKWKKWSWYHHRSDPPPFFKGRVNFNYLLQREGNLKNFKKWVEVWCRGRFSWKGADTFPIWYFQGLLFLRLQIILFFPKLCYIFEEKLFFSTTIILWKRSFQVV